MAISKREPLLQQQLMTFDLFCYEYLVVVFL